MPAIARQAIDLLRRLEEWAKILGEWDAPVWQDASHFLIQHGSPKSERRWVCPVCGSDDIQGLAWVHLNDEVIDDYDEGRDYWCPQCQEHYRRICEIDREGNCVNHDQRHALYRRK